MYLSTILFLFLSAPFTHLYFTIVDTWVCEAIFFFQLFTHFCIDVLKGKLNVWFPSLSNPANKGHWYVFGADQLAHQIVIILQTALILQFLI